MGGGSRPFPSYFDVILHEIFFNVIYEGLAAYRLKYLYATLNLCY